MDLDIYNFNQIGLNSVTFIRFYNEAIHKTMSPEEILSHARCFYHNRKCILYELFEHVGCNANGRQTSEVYISSFVRYEHFVKPAVVLTG